MPLYHAINNLNHKSLMTNVKKNQSRNRNSRRLQRKRYFEEILPYNRKDITTRQNNSSNDSSSKKGKVCASK
jgi:hypothetical protein